MSNQLPGDAGILDPIRSNKDLEKNPNFLPKSYFIGPLPPAPAPPRPLQHLFFSAGAVATLAFVLFLECAKLFLPQAICT